jgi:pantoate--beta-alanine ligase
MTVMHTAELITTRHDWSRRLDDARAAGQQVGLVPTMGSLHAGHLSLIRRAAADCDVVAVTDYVNPLQFGAAEDLASYPRDVERDRELAAGAGATVLFAPSVEEMWPEPAATTVRLSGVSENWEGAARPGHFDGVATIVAKLFALSGACWAYFGEKDWQQLAVVRRMALDLSLPVAVVGCPTVRDPDGLALSSRNAYLTDAERQVAATLYWSLLAGKRAIEDDHVEDPGVVASRMAEALGRQPAFTLDYAAAVDPERLVVTDRLGGEVRLLVAARLGRARLIDNLAATVPSPATNPAANPATHPATEES